MVSPLWALCLENDLCGYFMHGLFENMAFMKFEDFHENWFIYDLMFEKELYTMVFSTFNQWTSWT